MSDTEGNVEDWQMVRLDKAIAWNKDQVEHTQIIQRQVQAFCNLLWISAIEHDTSKWTEKEYPAFLASHTSLKGSKTGTDPEYQKHLKGDAIQHHIHNNPHHAEYWDARGELMPVHEVISMFFDWRSRSIAKGGDMEAFWPYNIAKLKNQPHAIPIVEALKREYCGAAPGAPLNTLAATGNPESAN